MSDLRLFSLVILFSLFMFMTVSRFSIPVYICAVAYVMIILCMLWPASSKVPFYVPGVLVFHNGYYNSVCSSIFSARYWLGFGHSKFYMGITSSIKVGIWHPPVSCVMNHNSRSVLVQTLFIPYIRRVFCHIAYLLPYAIWYFDLPCWSIFDVNCCLEVAVNTFNRTCVVVLLCKVHAIL